MDARTLRLLRFGDFELDVRAGELRKQGIRIRLQDQSFQILRMLLERPGEVVLREEIRQKLWPNNTIVEFDHSINAAIKRLRNALLESAEEPRYIETLAKRGYRFVGEVTGDLPKPNPDPVPQPRVDVDDLSGTAFSNFRVLEKLGAGGMGVVYRAEDLKLGRQVALKFLQFPKDELPASMIDRFEREARAASALNHPHICTVHSVDNFAGQPVIVMELVEGETLEARLARGRLPREEALRLAIQISRALAEAHRKGIVHRDLKPANIMLTKSGVKVLDFGLAMVASDKSIHQPGMVMGTLRYMSPEQAQGRETDARTDIFSFGVVLYEMLTGKHAFDGLQEAVEPESLNRVVEACLAKDPADRFQSARDVERALEWSASGATAAPVVRRWLDWRIAAGLAVALAAVAFLYFREKPSASAVPVRFEIPAPVNAILPMKLSPDGRKLAFFARGRLWVHYLDTGESRDLTENGGVPFWSPDSRFIGYSVPHKVLKIEATGGPPQLVAERGALWGGGTWNRDDTIVFAGRLAGIFRVPASGGVPVQIVAPDTNHQQFGPTFLPDGRHFLYTRTASDLTNGAIYVGSIDSKPEQQGSTPLASSDAQPEYAPLPDADIGHLLFVRNGALLAQPFDHRRMKLQGQAAPIADHVWTISDALGLGEYASFSASANNTLVFHRSLVLSPRLYRFTLFDWKGNVIGTIGEPASVTNGSLMFSPDGKRAAVTMNDGLVSPPTWDIWIYDVPGGTRTRLTFGPGDSIDPIWSPDGTRIAFIRGGKAYWKTADGTGDEDTIPMTAQNARPSSFSRDGQYMLYDVSEGQNGSDIWVQPLRGDLKPFCFLCTPANELQGKFSPDGRWVAYVSNETGPNETYVRPFPPSNGGKWLISKGGSSGSPKWRQDGKVLGYATPDGSVTAVPITTDPVFHAGGAEVVFKIPKNAFNYSTAPDLSRFLVSIPVDADLPPAEPFTVVLNWTSLLKK